MLATEKIAQGFLAIVEEAELLLDKNPSEEQKDGLKTIISIAKHQSDIRGASGTHCESHPKCG